MRISGLHLALGASCLDDDRFNHLQLLMDPGVRFALLTLHDARPCDFDAQLICFADVRPRGGSIAMAS
jgi:hypothetical protein